VTGVPDTGPLIYAAQFAKGKCGLLSEIKLIRDKTDGTHDKATIKTDLRGVDDVEMGEELVYISG